MKRSTYAILFAVSLLAITASQAATVAYWDFENSTETATTPTNNQPFFSGGSGGTHGTADAVNNVLMRGYSAAAGPSFKEGASPFGGFCMHVAGQDGYVNNDGNMFVTNSTPDWTLELHARFDETSGFETLVARMGASFGGNAGDLYFQRKGIDNYELRIDYLPSEATGGGDRITVDGTTTLNADTWYGLAVVADSGADTITLYVDDGDGYVMDGQTTGLTNDLGVLSTTFDWAFARDYWGGGLDNSTVSMDNVRFTDSALAMGDLLVPPFRYSNLSPIGQSSDTNPTIEATIVNHDSDYVSAELFLDGSSVATDNTPSGTGTNTISFAATGLTLTNHTAKVVVVGANPATTVTYQWDFDITQPAFDSVTLTAPANNSWTTNNSVDIEAVVVENFETVASATFALDGGAANAMASSSNGTTNTLTYTASSLSHGVHTGAVVIVGSGTEVVTNDVTFSVVLEGAATTTLVHHWDFETGASGTLVPDLAGSADGTIIGTNHQFVAGGLDLYGGGGSAVWNPDSTNTTGRGSYVDVGNGVISALSGNAITIEATWKSDAPGTFWQRIWDFGESTLGEDFSGTGGTDLFLTQHGPSGGPRAAMSTNNPASEMFQVEAPSIDTNLTHVVFIYDSSGNMAKMYKNGVLTEAEVVGDFALSGINDENCWFGRAQYNDGMFNGTLYDIRIYTGIMTASEVAYRYSTFGPSVTPNITFWDASSGTLTWDSKPGANYNILSRNVLTGPWGTNATVASVGTTTTGTVSTAASAEFFTIESN